MQRAHTRLSRAKGNALDMVQHLHHEATDFHDHAHEKAVANLIEFFGDFTDHHESAKKFIMVKSLLDCAAKVVQAWTRECFLKV